MKEKYFFKSNKIKYPEFLKTVEEMLKQKILFCDKNTIARGIDSLSNLNEEQQSKLINISYNVDRIFYFAGAANKNCARKLPIILTCADFLCNFNDKISDLSDSELILASYLYSTHQPNPEQNTFDFYLDKDVLKSIQSKSNDYYEQCNMIIAIGFKLSDLGVDEMDNEQYNATKKNMINTINNSSKEEILNIVDVRQRVADALCKAGL